MPPAKTEPASATPGLRRQLGALLAFAGLVALADLLAGPWTRADPRVAAAWTGGLVAAGATALGALPVLFSQRLSARSADAMLGFGAGVMLAATAFSLVMPALSAGRAQGLAPLGAALQVGLGVLLGAGAMLAAGRWVERRDAAAGPAADPARRRAALFVLAIALHNGPEGLAIGVASVGPGGDGGAASALVTGIALQDVPEGLVVALALRAAGHGRLASTLLGAATGLFEPVFALVGALAVGSSVLLLPAGLAFAAGAMLFATAHHAIPGAHEKGHATAATVGVVAGYVLMTVLDTAFASP